jgi:site-specific DNA recombinase
VQELNRRGWTTKQRTTKAGRGVGGLPFDKGNLHGLLTNPLYVGRIRHKDQTYVGEHEAVVDPAIFDRVQALLSGNGRTGGSRRGTGTGRCSRAY